MQIFEAYAFKRGGRREPAGEENAPVLQKHHLWSFTYLIRQLISCASDTYVYIKQISNCWIRMHPPHNQVYVLRLSLVDKNLNQQTKRSRDANSM